MEQPVWGEKSDSSAALGQGNHVNPFFKNYYYYFKSSRVIVASVWLRMIHATETSPIYLKEEEFSNIWSITNVDLPLVQLKLAVLSLPRDYEAVYE